MTAMAPDCWGSCANCLDSSRELLRLWHWIAYNDTTTCWQYGCKFLRIGNGSELFRVLQQTEWLHWTKVIKQNAALLSLVFESYCCIFLCYGQRNAPYDWLQCTNTIKRKWSIAWFGVWGMRDERSNVELASFGLIFLVNTNTLRFHVIQ